MPGVRWSAFGLMLLLATGMGLGAALEASWARVLPGQPAAARPDLEKAQALWKQSLEILHEFPLVGAGLGAFPSIQPYFKDRDWSSTTAMSSLLQWGVETGAVGCLILALGVLWCLRRIPTGLGIAGWRVAQTFSWNVGEIARPGCGSGRSRSHDAPIRLSPHSGQPIGPDSRRGDSLDHGANRPRGLLRSAAARSGRGC